jgi:Protein of unknown function (DUF3617)
LRAALALCLALAGVAHASVEPGNWEFSLESPLQGTVTGPTVKQRCLTPEEAADPAKVLAEARAAKECQFTNVRDSGTDYKFDVECTGRTPIRGSGTVRYTARALDGEIDLIAEAQGLRLKTRSFVSGRHLGPCNK